IRVFALPQGGGPKTTTRQNPKIIAASPLPSSLPDLHRIRDRLRRGETTAAVQLEESIALAQSPACERVFLKTSFDEARRVARDPASQSRPLMGLGLSVKDLFDIRGETTAAGSVVLADAPPAAQ